MIPRYLDTFMPDDSGLHPDWRILVWAALFGCDPSSGIKGSSKGWRRSCGTSGKASAAMHPGAAISFIGKIIHAHHPCPHSHTTASVNGQDSKEQMPPMKSKMCEMADMSDCQVVMTEVVPSRDRHGPEWPLDDVICQIGGRRSLADWEAVTCSGCIAASDPTC